MSPGRKMLDVPFFMWSTCIAPQADHLNDSPAPTALVTGASSGIGAEVATLLAERGYRTVLVARRVDRLADLAARLSALAPSVAVAADLADPGGIEPTLRPALERHGPIEVVVNCAGNGLFAPFLGQSVEQQRRLFEVHYFAPVAITRLVLPDMVRRRRGHVINIASMAAKMGPWGHSSYAAAKAALIAMTQSLAAEHRDDGVQFSYVCPGIVDTAFFARPEYDELRGRVRRYAVSPTMAARRIVGLLDRPRLGITIPGHYRLLDLVAALSPRFASWLVQQHSMPTPRHPGLAKAGRKGDIPN